MPSTGGCFFQEDPNLDAREAQPHWCIGAHPHVELVPHTSPDAQTFDLWAVPGRKALSFEGDRLWLHGERGHTLVTLKLAPSVQDGAPFAYALPAGAEQRGYRYTLEAALALLQQPEPVTPTALSRPSRTMTMHMRALQVLDGAATGASHRDIARVLFGARRVAVQWEADSDLRGQVRYLRQRGRAFMEGGYRQLLP